MWSETAEHDSAHGASAQPYHINTGLCFHLTQEGVPSTKYSTPYCNNDATWRTLFYTWNCAKLTLTQIPTTSYQLQIKVLTSFIQNTQDPHNIKEILTRSTEKLTPNRLKVITIKKKVHQSIVFSSACMCKALSLPLRIQSCDMCSSTVQLPLNP